ncbi:MAG TPA: sigma-70 family RNA polymerase sigma factor [Pyrinomonadaceae bacterium]|nr:sigma-70 family RNA polymerase sigma factor [Pyrinomonadaceae bacterium]
MFVDDDSKETDVSPTFATNMLLATDSTESATSETPPQTAAGNAELEGLGALFREHYKGIFRVAYRITGSQSDAEDVLQTIFVRLTPGWVGRDLSPNPRAFLYRAAINASLDVVRLRKRLSSVPLDVADLDQSSKLAVASPEVAHADAELRELLRQAVAKLEGRAATAFVLRYYEGYDNGRIAEVLGTSQMVVAVTLHRARTRLRKEIGNYLEKHHEAQ